MKLGVQFVRLKNILGAFCGIKAGKKMILIVINSAY